MSELKNANELENMTAELLYLITKAHKDGMAEGVVLAIVTMCERGVIPQNKEITLAENIKVHLRQVMGMEDENIKAWLKYFNIS